MNGAAGGGNPFSGFGGMHGMPGFQARPRDAGSRRPIATCLCHKHWCYRFFRRQSSQSLSSAQMPSCARAFLFLTCDACSLGCCPAVRRRATPPIWRSC